MNKGGLFVVCLSWPAVYDPTGTGSSFQNLNPTCSIPLKVIKEVKSGEHWVEIGASLSAEISG